MTLKVSLGQNGGDYQAEKGYAERAVWSMASVMVVGTGVEGSDRPKALRALVQKSSFMRSLDIPAFFRARMARSMPSGPGIPQAPDNLSERV